MQLVEQKTTTQRHTSAPRMTTSQSPPHPKKTRTSNISLKRKRKKQKHFSKISREKSDTDKKDEEPLERCLLTCRKRPYYPQET